MRPAALKTDPGAGLIAAALYALILGLSVWYLGVLGKADADELLPVIVIMGLGFSGLALVLTRGMRTRPPRPRRPGPEALAALVLLALIALYLVLAKSAVDALVPGDGLAHRAVATGGKVVVFVALPYAVFARVFGVGPADFGLDGAAWRALAGAPGLIVLILGAILCGFQWVAGSGAAPIRDGAFGPMALILGLPAAFLWLMVEVGLVEEFFFRGLLQTRLVAITGSPVAGIVIMTVLFGLIHAPGYILRGSGVGEAVGTAPGVLEAMAYTIAIQSVAGWFLAILWQRSGNLPLCMMVHAATDLLPGFPGLARAFGLAH